MTREQAEAITVTGLETPGLDIGDIVTIQDGCDLYMVVDPKTRKLAKPQRPKLFRVTAVAPIKLEVILDEK